MISDGAPPFITLAVCAGMMAVIMALINILNNMHLLSRPLHPRWPSFNFFRYALVTFIGYLTAQGLGIMKIIFYAPADSVFDFVIMGLLFAENATIITALVWLFRYRHELPPQPYTT